MSGQCRVIMKDQLLIETQLWLVNSQDIVLQTATVRKTSGEATTKHLKGQLAEELDAAKQEINKLKQAWVADQQMMTDLRRVLELSEATELIAKVIWFQKVLLAEK